MVAESKTSVCLEMGEQRDTGERAAKGTRKYLGLMDTFTMLIVVVVPQVDVYVETYPNVHGKHVQFII